MSDDLDRLGHDFFDLLCASSPLEATELGVSGHDGELPDLSRSAELDVAGRMRDYRDRAAAISPESLSDTDRGSRALLVHSCQSVLNRIETRAVEWSIGAPGGPVENMFSVLPKVDLTDGQRVADYEQRCAGLARYLDQAGDRALAGLADGLTGTKRGLEAAAERLASYLELPAETDPLLQPVRAAGDSGAVDRIGRIVDDSIRPAAGRLLDVIRDELLPAARPDDDSGVLHLPGGADIYRRALAQHTTTDRTPEELHQTGLRLIEELRAEFAELGGRVLGTTDVSEVQHRLREDRELRYATADEIVRDVSVALRRAEEAVPDWFGVRHKAPCEVREMNPVEAETAVLGYYLPPAGDGSRPGRHWINTLRPETRTRYEYETLAFHESVPGHHLQIAVTQELTGLPEFRRFTYLTPFDEGWALYTERLADQMGLYSSDLARFGMVSFDAWRASRLVVDTGMHAFGWSRQRAIDYMWANTSLTMGNIVNEVDRYVGWPGQALAYMTGRLEIVRLRELAQARLGAAFEIKAFHDAVIGGGSLPMGELAARVERWVATAAT